MTKIVGYVERCREDEDTVVLHLVDNVRMSIPKEVVMGKVSYGTKLEITFRKEIGDNWSITDVRVLEPDDIETPEYKEACKLLKDFE